MVDKAVYFPSVPQFSVQAPVTASISKTDFLGKLLSLYLDNKPFFLAREVHLM